MGLKRVVQEDHIKFGLILLNNTVTAGHRDGKVGWKKVKKHLTYHLHTCAPNSG